MSWRTILGAVLGALAIAAIDVVIGLTHAGLLAVGLVVLIIVGVLTLPDAGGLRRPREH